MNFEKALHTLLLLGISLVSACNSDVDRFIDAARAAELEIRSVQLTPQTIILDTGETQQMKFEATLADGSQYDLTNQASWASDDSGIASVDGNGLVTAGKQNGTTLIHTHFAGFNAQATVQVSNANLVSLEISGGNQVDVCKPLQLALTGSFDDGTTRPISGRGEKWSVTPLAAASIGSTGKLTVTGGTIASVEVSASKDGVTTSHTLTVSRSLESVILTKQPDPLAIESTTNLQATGQYRDGSSEDITSISSWSSTIPTIATVEPGGKVTGLAVGSTTVNATCGGITGSAQITVIPQSTVQAVEFENGDTEAKVNQGDKLSLSLSAIDNTGTRTTVTEDAEWSASQISGGTITVNNKSGSKGEVDTSNAGTALVTAKYKGHSATIQVIVESTAATTP